MTLPHTIFAADVGPHALATAPNAETHIRYHRRDSRASVLVHERRYLPIKTACPNPGVIGHLFSDCFTTICVEKEALRSIGP